MSYVKLLSLALVAAGIMFGWISGGTHTNGHQLMPGYLAMGIVCVVLGTLLAVPILIHELVNNHRRARREEASPHFAGKPSSPASQWD